MDKKALVEAQVKRVVTKLFKNFLVIIEDVRQDHLTALAEMSHKLTPEQLQLLNYLDFPKYSRIRKKILDEGNDSIREIQTILTDFEL